MPVSRTGLERIRGDHPDNDTLLALADGHLEPRQALEIRRHVQLCPGCALIVQRAGERVETPDDLTWARAERELDRRAGPWQPARRHRWHAIGLAATLVIAAGLGWMLLLPPAGIDPTVRGTGLSAVSPAAIVTELDEFAWTAFPLAARHRVTLAQDETVLWQQSTTGQHLELPANLTNALEVGVRYRWRVEALDDSGQVLSASGWTEFEFSSRTSPPFERQH